MRVGIVGGGINGLCTAWELAHSGCEVSLFERGRLLGETSSASSKLLHGGIRYLENGEFRLVKEALKERSWWLNNAPHCTSRLKLCLPVYEGGRRSSWKIKLGLVLYDYLADKDNIGVHSCVSESTLKHLFPSLKKHGLKRVFTFYDGQMDEEKLGAWVAEEAKNSGAILNINREVTSIHEDGVMCFSSSCHESFDCIVNVAGPWASALNKRSHIKSQYDLDLVRGSHILLNRSIDCGYLLEVPTERRVFFVLPYQGKTLIGTTEVRQGLDDPIECSAEEIDYLLAAYNHYFQPQAKNNDIIESFAGVRPLIKSADDPSKATREYVIERQGRVVSVFGGKWTTARALAKKVTKEVMHEFY